MKNVHWILSFTFIATLLVMTGYGNSDPASSQVTPAATSSVALAKEEARAIAKEAYIYANPMVDNYRIFYGAFVDETDKEYKTPINHLVNLARVYTHEDRSVQTANSDTPYSWLALDLRTEPYVLTVPEIEEGRYFSIQLIDLYTHNFAYIGSRTTGNGGGSFLIAGPGWKGDVPDGIANVIHCETELAVAVYRTQLFNPADMDNVKAVQAGYKVQPLSAFLGQPAPEAAPAIDFIAPLTREEIQESPEVFEQLNFVLQFCPVHPSEQDLMARFARLNIGAGKTFDWKAFPLEIQEAIGQGIADAWADFAALKEQVEAGKLSSGDVFGSREDLQNNYPYRMLGAVVGIWGLNAEEAIYPTYYVDADGEQLDGAHKYTLRFAPDLMPPVNSFWSLTMYELPESLMVKNPINRYLLNSPMLDDFVRDDDGGITLYLQHDSPGEELEPNWLPAPKGPFSAVMRLYRPKEEALDGTWKVPPLQRVK